MLIVMLPVAVLVVGITFSAVDSIVLVLSTAAMFVDSHDASGSD
jgi:hypothetical protein